VTVRADDDAGAGDPAVDALRAEPEPAWADEIRRGRRERAARLRSVFAAFDDDDDDEEDDGGDGGGDGDGGGGGEASPIERRSVAGDEEPQDR
jgi:hypothetical protein